MGKKQDRQNRIVSILKEKNFIPIKELTSILQVSDMTVRRDIDILESNNIAKNVDGMIVYNRQHISSKTDKEYNIYVESYNQSPEKNSIGQKAASFIEEDDIVVIDTGTTTAQIAQYLPSDISYTVLCYNVNILMELWRLPNVKILFSGGQYHPNTQMFECPQGIDFINSQRAHKAFISAAGVHSDLGLTCLNSYEVATKKAIINSSVEKILVADSSKFGAIHSNYFCNLDIIDRVITNSDLSEEWVNLIKKKNIGLDLV